MSKDHDPSEENTTPEENVNQKEQSVQEVSEVSEDVADAGEVVSEKVEEVASEVEESTEGEVEEGEGDVFEDNSEEDVFGEDGDETENLEVNTAAENVESPAESGETEPASEEDPAVEEEEVPEPKVDDFKRWYSLRVISGKERKIKERIELEISRSKWEDYVTQILVPSEKVYKIRNGKKVILERNILPGYILVEADSTHFTGEMIQAIANVPNVIHFLGKNNPIPMQQSEANRMLGKVDESQTLGEAMIEPFIVGETVKIIDGPFNEFVGDIQEVNEEKKKLKVIVKIFGRGTEVELNFIQVEKQQ